MDDCKEIDLKEIIEVSEIREEDWLKSYIDGEKLEIQENLNFDILDSIIHSHNDIPLSPLHDNDTYQNQEMFEIYTVGETEYSYGETFEVIETVEEIKTETKETELLKIYKKSFNIVERNQRILKNVIPKETTKEPKVEPISCSKCCRQFVHEGGLFRHWDHHIGEILAPVKLEVEKIGEVVLCVFCGEVFKNFQLSVDHLKAFHIEITEPKFEEFSIQNVVINESESSTQEVNSTSSVNKDEKKEPLTIIKFPVHGTPNSSEIFRMINLDKIFQCEFCDSVFSNMKAMFVHISKFHFPSACFECNSCNLKVLTIKEILLHRRDECDSLKEVENILNQIQRVWACNVCDLEFNGLEQLFLHRHETFHFFPRLEPRTNELLFLCETCTSTHSTAEEFVDHFKQKHQKKAKPDEVQETSERKLKPAAARRGGSHQTSTRPRQFLCEVCGKSYTQSSHLWQHLRFHQGVKPFECKVEGCSRKFTIRPDLNDHVRKCHTGERPYLCTICNKRFLTGSVFYQHRLIHRGERRYGCEECGKRFYRADALKNHLRIHSGEKPHICNVCNKAFRQRGDRDKHVKARHPDAPIQQIEPKKPKVKSFGRGRIRNNKSLYEPKPTAEEVAEVQGENQ